jgi:hypothetical protein
MMEMAAERYLFIPYVLYIYNAQTPMNDFKIRREQQSAGFHMIRAKEKYPRLPASVIGRLDQYKNARLTLFSFILGICIKFFKRFVQLISI